MGAGAGEERGRIEDGIREALSQNEYREEVRKHLSNKSPTSNAKRLPKHTRPTNPTPHFAQAFFRTTPKSRTISLTKLTMLFPPCPSLYPFLLLYQEVLTKRLRLRTRAMLRRSVYFLMDHAIIYSDCQKKRKTKKKKTNKQDR